MIYQEVDLQVARIKNSILLFVVLSRNRRRLHQRTSCMPSALLVPPESLTDRDRVCLQWRRRRLCMAVADARPPEGHCEDVSRPPDCARTATTFDVFQLTRPRVPGYFRCRSRRHLSVVTHCRGSLFHDYGSSPQRWAATARFLRSAAVASDGKASRRCREYVPEICC